MSNNFEIKTTLGVSPVCRGHQMIYIMRGSSASLNFSLLDKVYTFEDIEQVTFLFKQDSSVYKYEMINYSTEDKTQWTIDSHFAYDSTLKQISFLFSSTETLQFSETTPDNPVYFEVVIKLDTDSVILQGVDSVIIEPQHPIAIVDSIYASVIS